MGNLDPMVERLVALRAASDQTVAAYTEHLKGVVGAYRKHLDSHDRDILLNNMVKALMTDATNTREALCYQVVVAVDLLARRDS
jgi:hypothetical protein